MSNHKRRRVIIWILWIVILMLLGVLGTSIYAFIPVRPNTPAYFRKYYHINRRQLEETAAAYGLSVAEISDYGPEPFPINYVKFTLEWEDNPDYRTQTVSRKEVEAVIRDVQSRCKLGDWCTIYLFYARWIDETLIESVFKGNDGYPLAMTVCYEITPELERDRHIVNQIQEEEIGPDTGTNWRLLTETCEPPALYRDP